MRPAIFNATKANVVPLGDAPFVLEVAGKVIVLRDALDTRTHSIMSFRVIGVGFTEFAPAILATVHCLALATGESPADPANLSWSHPLTRAANGVLRSSSERAARSTLRNPGARPEAGFECESRRALPTIHLEQLDGPIGVRSHGQIRRLCSQAKPVGPIGHDEPLRYS